VVVRVHGSGRVQDGFGIQTKQGQLLLPLVHLFRSIHSDSQPDLSGLLYPLLVVLGSVANFTLAFFQLQYQSPYLIRVHVSVPAWL